jgi:hypothetical protein
MPQHTDQVGPRPYDADALIADLSTVLAGHGFVVEIKPVSTSELRWHAAALLHLLLGGSPWSTPGRPSA